MRTVDHRGLDAPRGRTGAREQGPRRPSLAFRLDEAAVAIHPITPVKAALNLLGALMGSMILPWQVCVGWAAFGLAIEAWGWFATRAQFRGRAVDWRARANFAAHYVTVNLWWLLLGVLFWRSGTMEGQASAAILFVALGSVFVLLFYNTPTVFLVAGAAPAVAALSVVTLADGRDWRQILPIWIALGLTAAFNLGRALDTPSAQAQQRRLNESLDRYRILAENVTDVIIRADLAGSLQYVSPASLAVVGYRPDELLGQQRSTFIHPESLAVMETAYRQMLGDPDRPVEVITRVRCKDGRWVWLHTSAKMVLEHGVPVGVIDVSRDITERVAADDALREAKAEAESASRAKAEFLANVSHEIRTPMNGVLGALHLLERENISVEGRELMRQASDCGRMLSQLLNDVLDFSKIEAGQLDLAPEPMDVGEALTSVTALLEGQARAKGVALTCEIAGEALWIDADPVRLRQAMFNLIGNAVKFTTEGRVTARLAVTAREGGRRHVRLEVQDTGIGMTAEAQSHLFERFRQAENDTARRFGGTGLGLSITRALAHMMGGEITFDSLEGQGSTFRLAFEAPGASPAVVEAVEEGLLDGVNILLVEDNPTNRLVARTMLARLGARIEEAEDGVAGLEAARRGSFHLILMDIQMPHMDGVETTRAIRGLVGAAAEVPIIGLTANVMVHQRVTYLAAGMNGVVAKPISAAALLGEIARLLAEPETALAS
ncbi:ATP-binding protein [Phenylobacterium sp.]|uniref:hybrid sensor histidine kinase/response regulator n=1 Tax=Phenylobacterium sp. TaxID=1871053 RepID=UPI00286CB860|nr:ATP-binding protein [Phenylobacterium sp.]